MCGDVKKTFGFNAEELDDGSLKGNVQFIDHGLKLNIHGYDITALTIVGNEATIQGLCKVNGDDGFTFRVFVRDVNEPGKHDWFQIELLSGPIAYNIGAELGFPEDAGGGGNIQIHVPAL